MADFFFPAEGIDPAMLGDHPALLRLRVHHTHQPGLLPQRVPSEKRNVVNCFYLCSKYTSPLKPLDEIKKYSLLGIDPCS